MTGPINLDILGKKMSQEISLNNYNAKLLRLLADVMDGRSDAQAAQTLIQMHGNADDAVQWMKKSTKDAFKACQMLLVFVALESAEKRETGGAKKPGAPS